MHLNAVCVLSVVIIKTDDDDDDDEKEPIVMPARVADFLDNMGS